VFRALDDFKPFFEKEFGTRVDIEQIEGAAGLIGYNEVYSRPADGYTIVPMSQNFGPHTYPYLSQTPPPWKFEDWVPLGMYADNLSSGFVVLSKSDIQTFPDFIRAAKANPGKLNVGSIGPGRIEDVQVAELEKFFDIDVNQVYYDASGNLLTDLLTGDLDVLLAAALNYVDNPDTRIITMLAAGMTEDFPHKNLKTMADWQEELGYKVGDLKTLASTQWYGLAVKAGLPQETYDRLVLGLKNVAENPEWQAKVADYRDVVYYPPEKAAELLASMRNGIEELMQEGK
jgi:tripartite-type tricarboxylate transporter receptor subunit TctC